MSDDILELNYWLMEEQRRIAEEKAEAEAQAEAARILAADHRDTIITRTASKTVRTRAPPSLSRSPQAIKELLERGHDAADIALHLGIGVSRVQEIREQSRSPEYDRLLRKFMETGELEYPNQGTL